MCITRRGKTIIRAYAISNIGNVRENHEDNLFVPMNSFIDSEVQKSITSNTKTIEYDYEGEEGVFAVCDGMGGHNAGEVASRIAVETISKSYKDILVDDKNKLLQFIKDLNNKVCDYGDKNPDCDNMGSTFSGLIVLNKKMYLLHVGDSRIYKFENGDLKQISKDHTEGCRLVESGVIKKEDLPKFPNRKSLYKYLGRKVELIADCDLIEKDFNGRYIIASDGLSDTLNDSEISDIISKSGSAKSVCQDLLKACLEKGNTCSDNVTIICIDID